MIKFIAAIDSSRGIADDEGIPWQGLLPSDVNHFRDMTAGGALLMGFRTYEEFAAPLSDRHNFVATGNTSPLRPGFEPVLDTFEFLDSYIEDIWIIGGAGLFQQTLVMADELYLTHIEKDFDCTKFFPEFSDEFEISERTDTMTENNIPFYFATWRRKV